MASRSFRVSRPLFDLGLFSGNPAMLDFYEHVLALPLEDILQHSPTYQERFYGIASSGHHCSLKINYTTEGMEPGVSGYTGLLIAREGLNEPRTHTDPDGLAVTLVPPGWRGITGVGIEITVPDIDAQRRFLVDVLGCVPDTADDSEHGYTSGETRVFVKAGATGWPSPTWRNGFNYILVPVDDVAEAHSYAITLGAAHGLRPIRLADRCVFSWIRDPNGNWVEFVQYTDTGPLPDIPRADTQWDIITAWRDRGTPA